MSEPQVVKILNYEYQNQPADLINARPEGPVQGYHLNYDSNNQSWIIVAVGGNNITIQNGSTKTYANPAFEADDAPVIGGTNAYRWQQLSVPGGWFQIATNDGKFVWYLTGNQDYDPIVLRPVSYQGKDAQWGYQPTPWVN